MYRWSYNKFKRRALAKVGSALTAYVRPALYYSVVPLTVWLGSMTEPRPSFQDMLVPL
jgi:hypothetical protein